MYLIISFVGLAFGKTLGLVPNIGLRKQGDGYLLVSHRVIFVFKLRMIAEIRPTNSVSTSPHHDRHSEGCVPTSYRDFSIPVLPVPS
jgi:hypothetical protein